MASHQELLREAVRLAQENRRRGGRPFGAVIAIDGAIVGTGVNEVHLSHDPTAHAEIEAVRAASRRLARPLLQGSIAYASGHPCPMCLAAMLGAGVEAVYYALGREDAAAHGFSGAASYERLRLPLDPPPLPLTRLEIGVTAAELYGSP